MPIKFKCAKCNKELTVKDEMAGKQGKCPGCQSVVSVPAAGSSAVASPAPAPARKKSVEEDDEAVEAAVVEEDEVAAEVVEDEEDAPKKKKKTRRDEDDEDEEDDRRSKAKKKSSRRDEDDEDDDDEDDRPRKKKASAKKRDDDDEDDEEEEEEDIDPKKKRRIAFRRAALGMKLNFIGHLVFAGAVGITVIFALLEAIMSSSKGVSLGFQKFMNYMPCIVLIGAMIVNVVGSAFLIMTPGKHAEFGLAIATCATAGLSAILVIVRMANVADPKIPLETLNPCAGFMDGPGGGGGPYPPGFGPPPGWGYGRSGGITAILYLLPLLELGRMACLALYQWGVGKSQKDRETAKTGFLMVILAPSVFTGIGFLIWMLLLMITITTIWVPVIFTMFQGIVVGGMLLWYALVMTSARETLARAR